MIFPQNPYDGQIHVINDPSGTQIVYEYNLDQNTWELVPGGSSVELDTVINTDEVITVPLNPFESPVSVDAIDDIINLQNQREINWVIAGLAVDAQSSQTIQNERIASNELAIQDLYTSTEGISSDQAVQDERIASNELAVQDLYTITDGISADQVIQDQRISANELGTQDLYSITDNHNTRINANSALILDNRNDIIELEEEIEALAPSLERGNWNYSSTGIASAGQFTMYNITGDVTDDYNSVATIFVNPVDSSGLSHGFSDVSDGSYLEIFDADDEDFGLYQVTDIDDQTGGQSPFWIFTVDFVKANKSPNEANGVARFKFFELADAADPTAFVLKAGDTMSGPLNLQDEEDIPKYTLGDNKAYLKFTTKNSSGNEQTCGLFQAGYSTTLLASSDFMSGGSIYTTSAYFGGTATQSGYTSYPPFMRLNEDSGEIKYSQKQILVWNSQGVTLPNPSPSSRANSFTIMGKTGASYDSTEISTDEKLFYVSHYPNELDGIFYNGRITYNNHITTKKYVDDNVRPIEIVPGNPANPEVGDAWFSTNQNTFIIKIA